MVLNNIMDNDLLIITSIMIELVRILHLEYFLLRTISCIEEIILRQQRVYPVLKLQKVF